MIVGLAHTAVCVPDLDVALAWYESTLGLRVLSPPYRMEGEAIERDMGELVPPPVVVRAAIVGFDAGDHVLEVIEYPSARGAATATGSVLDTGLTHVGVVCDDVAVERDRLIAAGANALTSQVAAIAGLSTAWVRDPFGIIWILLEKRHADRPYWRQHAPG